MDKLIHRLFQWLKMFIGVEEQQISSNCLWAAETPGRRRLVLKAFSVLPVIVRKNSTCFTELLHGEVHLKVHCEVCVNTEFRVQGV